MAEGVVHLLEAVEVEQQHGQATLVVPAVEERLVGATLELQRGCRAR